MAGGVAGSEWSAAPSAAGRPGPHLPPATSQQPRAARSARPPPTPVPASTSRACAPLPLPGSGVSRFPAIPVRVGLLDAPALRGLRLVGLALLVRVVLAVVVRLAPAGVAEAVRPQGVHPRGARLLATFRTKKHLCRWPDERSTLAVRVRMAPAALLVPPAGLRPRWRADSRQTPKRCALKSTLKGSVQPLVSPTCELKRVLVGHLVNSSARGAILWRPSRSRPAAAGRRLGTGRLKVVVCSSQTTRCRRRTPRGSASPA